MKQSTDTRPMSTLSVMDKTGDTAYAWPTGAVDDKSTAQVRAEFDKLMAGNNLLAVRDFYEDEPHGPGELGVAIKEFDPMATKITLSPGNYAGG